MRGNTREVEGLTWNDGAATVVDGPLDDGNGGLEWDTDESETARFDRSLADDQALQWIGMMGFSQVRPSRAVAAPVESRPLPGVRRLSATAQAFLAARDGGGPAVVVAPPSPSPSPSPRPEPFVADHTERTARPWLGPRTWMGFAAGMLAASLLLLVLAVVVSRSGRTSVAAGPIAVIGPVAARAIAAPPALLEAVDVAPVRATAATSGVVRRAAARGTALRAGEALVELRRPNPAAAQKLDALNELYEESGNHEAEIERARAAYERARQPILLTVRAPGAGLVVGEPPRPGVALAAGEELARVAAAVRLVMAAGDVEGSGATCQVLLLDRPGVLLDGRLVPGPDARSRSISLASFPADLPLGAVGRVRAICQ
jgi:hypothetical protein